MSIWIDRKYLLFVSGKLLNFKQKKDTLYQFRCPFCDDSKKNKLKARGYVYQKQTSLFFRCHNCGVGKNMYNFISFLDPSLAKEYSLEVFRENNTTKNSKTKDSFDLSIKSKIPVFEKPEIVAGTINLPSISSLEDDNIAKQYVLNRKIPKGLHKDLFYAEDFKKFVDEILPDHGKVLLENDPRLIIPFRDREKNLIAFQGRSLTNNKLRYITIKLIEDDVKIYGIDRLDISKKIYVTEGPIDSMFLNNAVATADSNLSMAGFLGKSNVILVYDNEPRNLQIVKQIEKSIDSGFKVCLLPESFKAKDINEAVMKGFTKPEIHRIIDSHIYDGIRAKLEFNKWKKC